MLLSFLLLPLSIIFRKSKIFSILILLYCWVLFGFNSDNGDYVAYKIMYDQAESYGSIFGYEAGYKLCMLLSKSMGVDFQGFMKLISFFILTIIGAFTFKFSKFPSVFLTVFLIVILPIQYVLLRNFLAFTIFLISIYLFLAKSDRKFIIYGVLSACTIHISSFFYFLVYLSTIKIKISVQKIAFFIIIGLFAFIVLNDLIISNLLTDVGGRNEIYLNSFPQFVLYSCFQIANYILIRWYFVDNNNIEHKFKYFLLSMNMFLLFLIIIYFNYAIFIRIFMNLAIVNILFMINALDILKKQGMKRFIILVLYLLFLFFVFVYPVKDDSLIPLYENNLIF